MNSRVPAFLLVLAVCSLSYGCAPSRSDMLLEADKLTVPAAREAALVKVVKRDCASNQVNGDTLSVLEKIRQMHGADLSYDTVFPLYEEALTQVVNQNKNKVSDEELKLRTTLAQTYIGVRKVDNALDTVAAGITRVEASEGKDSPKLMELLNYSIGAQCGKGQCVNALPEVKRLLELRRKYLGERDPLTITAYQLIAEECAKANHFELSEKYLKLALERIGKDSPQSIMLSMHLSRIFMAEGKMGEAKTLLLQVQPVAEKYHGKEGIEYMTTLKLLKEINDSAKSGKAPAA